MSELPETLVRWCCQGKSCGNTTLELATQPVGGAVYWGYTRVSNGNSYSGWYNQPRGLLQWVEETKDDLNCTCTCTTDPYACPQGQALVSAIHERKGNQ